MELAQDRGRDDGLGLGGLEPVGVPAGEVSVPVGVDVVERSINLFKHWGGLATRYDKLALTYRGAVVLASITIWLRH